MSLSTNRDTVRRHGGDGGGGGGGGRWGWVGECFGVGGQGGMRHRSGVEL